MSVRLLSGVLIAAALTACERAPLLEVRPDETSLIALWALGDTGEPRNVWPRFAGQARVARALAAEDERAPADALLFLGDNFYPHGLLARELAARVEENLVAPYCRFVAAACGLPAASRRVIPLYAVLGNHDHGRGESPALQRERVPRLVPNWRIEGSPVDRLELGHGVSLVFYDSTRLRRGEGLDSLRDALRASRGPWRILVAHHPLADDSPSDEIRAAIAASGVRVHALAAGHLHDLRIATGVGAEPALQVVAGSGSHTERPRRPLPGERFQLGALGFARIAVVRDEARERLRIALFRLPLALSDSASLAAVWEVTPDGVALPYSGAGPGN